MNYRDKRLAHSLAQTGREKVGPIAPMRLGDEREMLTASCEIVEVLHRVVNGASFSFADAAKSIAKMPRHCGQAASLKLLGEIKVASSCRSPRRHRHGCGR